MRRATLVILSLLLLAGCGPAPLSEAGWVVDVQSTSLTDVESFTLRTEDGRELEFKLAPLELDGGSFPASHLREHLALNQPVAIAYRDLDGERVAYRLRDAPWLQP